MTDDGRKMQQTCKQQENMGTKYQSGMCMQDTNCTLTL